MEDSHDADHRCDFILYRISCKCRTHYTRFHKIMIRQANRISLLYFRVPFSLIKTHYYYYIKNT